MVEFHWSLSSVSLHATHLFCTAFLCNKNMFYNLNSHTGIRKCTVVAETMQKSKMQESAKKKKRPTAADRKWKTSAFSEIFLFIPLSSQTGANTPLLFRLSSGNLPIWCSGDQQCSTDFLLIKPHWAVQKQHCSSSPLLPPRNTPSLYFHLPHWGRRGAPLWQHVMTLPLSSINSSSCFSLTLKLWTFSDLGILSPSFRVARRTSEVSCE